jgi:hypothetical protein
MGKFGDGMPEQGGGWFKFAEGNNRMRIVSDGAVMSEHFKQGGGGGICYGRDKGCPGCKEGLQLTYKKMYRIIDRKKVRDAEGNEKDAGMKLVKLGNKIIKQLDALSENEDYAFDSFPMPYDITINAVGAGTKEVEYSVVPSPKIIPLTPEEEAALVKEHSPADIVKTMKEKQMKKDGNLVDAPGAVAQASSNIEYPKEDIDPDQIPF